MRTSADLIGVEGDSTADIGAFVRIRFVMMQGLAIGDDAIAGCGLPGRHGRASR